jgi:alpha-amylase/alpha-mannosidase (GH57 family)
MLGICIHGHFYQPPREDPLKGAIPDEYGATPYRNWNERIHAECYRPNAELGNFGRLSFNVGPTLFGWMAAHDGQTYQRILEQDRATVQRFGVGNAMAQAYNHVIMPFASTLDKITQVRWGIADFVHRFGRPPQGMWLPETAVDTETLCIMADLGIAFTILAPWQAATDHLDPTEPYRIPLPNGKSIAAFFYNRDLSGRVSFDPAVTTNADAFVLHDLPQHFRRDKLQRGEAQLIMVASDGELYGHHQPFRDKFLAYLLNEAGAQAGIAPTFPARWLRDHPPRWSVGIRDNTSWSCHHGVARWADICPCMPGHSAWKRHLRGTLNTLARRLDAVYSEALQPYLADPWELRHRLIHVMLGRQSADELIRESASRRLPAETTRRIRRLLEAQWQRQRMFTSCGWFFDDFDRIEPKNNVAYAAQAVALTRQATGIDLAPQTRLGLQQVVSWKSRRRAAAVFDYYLARADGAQRSGSRAPLARNN